MATKAQNGKKVKAHIQYRVNGKRVPGVTTILGELSKPALKYWANAMGLKGIDIRQYVDDKADIGTLAHAIVLAHLRGEEVNTDDYTKKQIDLAENSFIKYLDWEKGKVIKPILLEEPLVSERHGYGGTIDNYCDLDGALTLVDYKTSGGIYPEMFYQLAAYQQLLQENGHSVTHTKILRIGRDENEGFEERDMRDLTLHFDIFIDALDIYSKKKLIKSSSE